MRSRFLELLLLNSKVQALGVMAVGVMAVDVDVAVAVGDQTILQLLGEDVGEVWAMISHMHVVMRVSLQS